MLIQEFLEKSTKLFPEKIAVINQNEKFSYSQINKFAENFALYLVKKGIKKGDRVAIFLDNSCWYLIYYFGILKSGAVVVTLNSQLLSRELLVHLDDCSPKYIITDKNHEQTVQIALNNSICNIDILITESLLLTENDSIDSSDILNAIEISEQDLAVLIYTSGTTGKPKGVMLTHRNISFNADSIIEYLHLTSNDKIMDVLPFYYSYGASLLTTHIKVGGSLVIENRFVYPNIVLDTMLKEETTGFAGVPSHYAILLKKSAISQYKFPKLRYVTQAGGGMAPAMIKEFLTILNNIKFYVMYGQTEATARLSYLEPEFLFKKLGSIGKNIPGVELDVLNENGEKVKVGEVGEIVARGQNIMSGYWNAPEETKKVLGKEGLHTGDLARIDEDGFIYIISRKKDMIKSGANRISPLEIEDIVYQMPGILECAAIGVPDDILGEAIKLFVVLNDQNISEKDILIYCKSNLAFYKIPKEIEIILKLPKTASGKIKREELKKRISNLVLKTSSI